MGQSVLVTGGSGFVGSFLLKQMFEAKDRFTVTAYDLAPDRHMLSYALDIETAPAGFELLQGDIMDLPNLMRVCERRSVEAIVHLAALKTTESQRNPHLATQVNCVGTLNVFECARILGIKRVVYASSISAFGSYAFSEDHLLANDGPQFPDTVYAACKAHNERMGRVYHKEFGLQTIGLRFGHGIGPGRTRGHGVGDRQFVDNPALGQPGVVAHGDSPENWLSVEDLAGSAMAALAAPDDACGGTYTIAGTDIRSRREAIKFIKSLLPDWEVTVQDGKRGRHALYDVSAAEKKLNWKARWRMEEALLAAINNVRRVHGLSQVQPR